MTIADIVRTLTVDAPSVRFVAYDDSSYGPPDPDYEVHLLRERGLRYLATAPGDLGLARAYISGDLDVRGMHPGDPYDAMVALMDWRFRRPLVSEAISMVRELGWRNLLPPEPPPQESVPRWRRTVAGLRHSRTRDAAAIHHHYDVSNYFYEKVLGPSMAYTCAVFPTEDASLEQAQQEKFDLVARKLGLTTGSRLLDVGCGWGGMARHAATEYGANVVAVTLSEQQARWAQERVERDGLSGQVTVLHADYRDAPGHDYDAISSIGLTEHIGLKNYPAYFALLLGKLRTGGRLLNHCITRADNKADPLPGDFIERYIFPDGELASAGRIITVMHDSGFEVVHEENLRQHYTLTLKAWNANLQANWDACVADVGEPTAKVWGIYLAGSRLGFETNSVQLHQVLGVKTPETGQADYPLRPQWHNRALHGDV